MVKLTRRDFLKLSSLVAAAASTGGCAQLAKIKIPPISEQEELFITEPEQRELTIDDVLDEVIDQEDVRINVYTKFGKDGKPTYTKDIKCSVVYKDGAIQYEYHKTIEWEVFDDDVIEKVTAVADIPFIGVRECELPVAEGLPIYAAFNLTMMFEHTGIIQLT